MGKTPVLSPTDIITGIVAYLFESNVTEFPTDRRQVHKALFQLREELGGILRYIPFDTRDIYPYSPAVDEAISNMQATDDLQRNNPRMARFKIGASAKQYFDVILAPEFSAKQKKEMKAIAERLAQEAMNGKIVRQKLWGDVILVGLWMVIGMKEGNGQDESEKVSGGEFPWGPGVHRPDHG